MNRLEYSAILLFFFITGLILQKRFKIILFKNLLESLYFYGFVILVVTVWDNFAVWRGHWFYPGKGIIGIFIGLIPLEDYFFGIISAYFLLVLYKVITKKI